MYFPLRHFAPCKEIQDRFGLWTPSRGFRIPRSGFQSFSEELDSGFQSFGDSNFLSCFPDSKAQDSDSGFHEQQCPVFRNPNSLSRGKTLLISMGPRKGYPFEPACFGTDKLHVFNFEVMIFEDNLCINLFNPNLQ